MQIQSVLPQIIKGRTDILSPSAASDKPVISKAEAIVMNSSKLEILKVRAKGLSNFRFILKDLLDRTIPNTKIIVPNFHKTIFFNAVFIDKAVLVGNGKNQDSIFFQKSGIFLNVGSKIYFVI